MISPMLMMMTTRRPMSLFVTRRLLSSAVPPATAKAVFSSGAPSWHRHVTYMSYAQVATAAVVAPALMIVPNAAVQPWQAYASAAFMAGTASLFFFAWQYTLQRLVTEVRLSPDESTVYLASYTNWAQVRWFAFPAHSLTMDVLKTMVVRNTKFYSVTALDQGINKSFLVTKDPAFCDNYDRLEFILNGRQKYIPPS
jgi:hypothetical protein